jgi:probable F420-dependent oxidoreductase
MFENFVTLSYLAGVTSTIRLGNCILVLPLRHPIVAAKQVAALDALSGGRVIFGVSAGAIKEEFDLMKVPYEMRGRRTDEYLQVLKQLWTMPKSSFEGKYFSYEGLESYPKPVQKPHPPIWVGGRTKFSLKRTARFGDGWMPGPGREGSPPEFFVESREYMKKHAKRYGRNVDDIKLIWEGLLSIDNTKSEAIEKCRLTMETKYGTMEKAYEANFIGTPDDIIKKLQDYLDVDVDYFQIKLVDLSFERLLKSMKLLSEEVFPSFNV